MKKHLTIFSLLILSIFYAGNVRAQIIASPKNTLTCPGQSIHLSCGVSSGTGSNIPGDDDFSGIINIGFNFDFYGTAYTQFVASDNGFITFDITRAFNYSAFTYPGALGAGDLNRAIMFPFQDVLLNLAISNRYSFITFGNPGSRLCVIQACQVPLFSCTNILSSSQIVLYEGSNIIDINIINKPSGCTWQQGTGIVGIRNAPAEMLVPGKDVPNVAWADQNKTYRFTPNATGGYNLDSTVYRPQSVIAFPDTNRIFWYAEGDTVNPIGTGANINVVPDGNIDYYVAKYYGDGLCHSTDTVAFYDTCYINYNNFKGTTNAQICAGETYQFYGRTLFQSGKYTEALKSYQGCDSTLELNLIVNPLPVVTLNTTSNIEICDGLTKTIEIISIKPNETIKWFKDGVQLTETAPKLVISEGGIYYAEVTTSAGCSEISSTVNVVIRPTPNAELESIGDGSISCTYDTVLLQAKHQQDAEYYWWPETAIKPFNYNLYASAVRGIFRDLQTPMTLTVKNQYGCVDTSSFVVYSRACCEVFIPNAFSPNGDGSNELFAPVLRPHQNIISFSIYDRLGTQVYESSSNSEGWNGTYKNGKEAPSGVYMYQVVYTCDDGKNYTRKDALTLLR